MNKTLPILAIMMITLFSCEKETVNPIIENETNLVATPDNIFGNKGADCCHEENLFERQLQWISFITAKVLRGNDQAQIDFNTYLSTNFTESMPMEKALFDDLGLDTTFKDDFDFFLSLYLSGSFPEPDTEADKPGLPPTPPPFGAPTTEELMENFYTLMLDENCIELFFPSGLNFTGQFTITSSSHPLTIAGSNEGIIRYYELQGVGGTTVGDIGDGSYEDGYVTEQIVLTNFYVNNTENIIIVRPVRNTSIDSKCLYDEYPYINFEDFMD